MTQNRPELFVGVESELFDEIMPYIFEKLIDTYYDDRADAEIRKYIIDLVKNRGLLDELSAA